MPSVVFDVASHEGVQGPHNGFLLAMAAGRMLLQIWLARAS